MKKLIWKIVLAASLLLMVVAAANIVLLSREYQKGINTYANLEKYATVTQDSVKAAQEIRDTADSENMEEAVEEIIEGPQIAVDLDIDYDALTKINGDFVGWIYYAPLELSYPIVRGIDNDYYTHYTFENVRNSSGAIFMDFLNKPDFSHFNTIIYGHNMKNGSMFASLLSYADPKYWEEHPDICFDTLEEIGEYEVLAVFYSQVYPQNTKGVFRYYQYTDLGDPDQFAEYIKQVQNAALYDTAIQAEYGDQLITLSTCSYHTKDGRFVVVARKV